MKKSTKFAALFAAVALLVLGAAMTSFAYGWVNEAGIWKYQNKSGDYVTQEWKSSGSNWYWLDENGEMATNQLVEDDDKMYYVNETGAMVTNTWISFDPEDDDKGEIVWRYFQANGKAYKKGTGSDVSWKTINGKKYTFDDNGKMLWGWLSKDGELLYEEDDDESTAWETALYYCGDWNDGARVTSDWRKITVYDDTTDKQEDKDYYFWFQASGKKFAADADAGEVIKDKKINGKYYGFDKRGVMQSEWAKQATDDDATLASDWKYFSDPESGARITKGWFQAIPKKDHVEGDYNDDKARWFYGGTDGKLAQSELKKINGKWYAFNESGVMLSGLQLITFKANGSIDKAVKLDKESDDEKGVKTFTYKDGKAVAELPENQKIMFFSNNEQEDGSMKTGAQTVNVDGDDYAFYFNKNSGDGKGEGLNGLKDKVYYVNGRKVKAGSDDKYIIVELKVDEEGEATKYVQTVKVDPANLIVRADSAEEGGFTESEFKKYAGSKKALKSAGKYRVVSTSGTYVTGTTSKKDGNDYYLYVKDAWLTGIYVEKN